MWWFVAAVVGGIAWGPWGLILGFFVGCWMDETGR